MANTAEKLSDIQIDQKLHALPGWRKESGMLVRDFKFADFKQAFAFMTKVAGVVEELNHHPEWTNVYNRLTVKLSTHDAGGVTEKDFELASRMNALG